MTKLSAERLGQLIDAHAAALELYASQWTKSPADVVQEAFVELIKSEPIPDRIVGWLFRVVRNRAINVARSERRRRDREVRAAEQRELFWAPPHAALSNELEPDDVAGALQKLPDDQREVIVARLWGELNFEEIAKLIGTSRSSAHRRYEAGIEALRKRLTGSCPNQTR